MCKKIADMVGLVVQSLACLDGGESMRDDQDGAPGHEAINGRLHQTLAHCVQCTRRLVQHQDR